MNRELRARSHAALGDTRRLTIVDNLALGDLTVAELGEIVELPGNLLAHHLEVLEGAGLIERRVSEGDHRRRYVSLRWDALPSPAITTPITPGQVAFVCTHNSARSQFAAALWEAKVGNRARSAGTEPADQVHPMAVRVATEFGLDLSEAVPASYETLPSKPGLIISVCDRARESGVPRAGVRRHWSIPDPVSAGTLQAFRSAFAQIAVRIDRVLGGSTP